MFESTTHINYLILRMNRESVWDDGLDTYHYGRISNYTKIQPGSAVILERKSPKGPELLGSAVVISVSTLPDHTFIAKLNRTDFPVRFYTEYERQQLKHQVGYNRQFSIRLIDAALYKSLSSNSPERPGF